MTIIPYVGKLGWLSEVKNGEQVGTTGISHQLEAVKIEINGMSDLNIEYSAHVANVGWQEYVSNGDMAGTTQQDAAIEAIKIRLTGSKSDEYDIFYRAYVAKAGWQSYFSEDEIAGTTGESTPVEAIQIVLLKKEKDISVDNKADISYSTYTCLLYTSPSPRA